jgi:hypothetical protein
MYKRLIQPAIRTLIALALIAVGVAVLALSIGATGNAAHKDFISYWAAGQLLVRHANPYDAAAVFELEKSVGFSEPQPLVMRNPPFALVLAMPLGLLGPNAGVVVWSLMIVGALMVSVRILWSIYGKPPDRLHMLIYIFAPALACMQLGQTSTFVLLALVLFLLWHAQRPFAAGLVLPLLFIKPHLFVVFGVVLAAWLIARRAWLVLSGAVAGTLPALALAAWFDPRICLDYLPVLHNASLESALIPTVSSLARLWLFHDVAWTQYAPALFAAAWALRFFARHRQDWDWNDHGMKLLLFSVWLAPYSWFTDEILLAPAILQAIYRCAERGPWLLAFGAIDAVALALVVGGLSLGSGAYIWTCTAWVAWYFLAARSASAQLPSPAAAVCTV